MGQLHKLRRSYAPLYFLLFATAVTNIILDWPIVRFIGLKQESDYGDTFIILKAVDCFSEIGLDVFKVQSGECSYNYGESLLRTLHLLNLGVDDVSLLGNFFVLLVIASYIECLRVLQPVATVRIQIIGFLFFCSPPIMLLLERGNFDSLIFALVVLAVVLEIKGKYLFSNTIILITVLFKFYTFAVFAINSQRRSPRRGQMTLLKAIVIVTFCWLLKEVALISQGFSIPNPMTFAFGSSKIPWFLGKLLGFELPRFLQLVMGMLIPLIITLIIYQLHFVSARIKQFRERTQEFQMNSLIMINSMSIIFVASYFTGMNYIYRLVFIIPIFVFILSYGNTPRIATWFVVMVATFFSSPMGGLEIIGDICLLVMVVLLSTLFLLPDNLQKRLRIS